MLKRIMSFSQYTTQTAEEVLKNLNSSEKGISEEEAVKRRKIYGLNEIKGSRSTLWDILFRQFKSPFFYLLFSAGIIAVLIGEKTDSIAIFMFVIINVALGFYQESRAEHTIALLRKYVSLTAKVLRNGKENVIDRPLLVPGDIVKLEAGNIVPADSRILSADNLLIDESVLTGESAPVYKTNAGLASEAKEIFDAKNFVFCGTSVIGGEAEAAVIFTGKETALGEIAKIVTETKKESAYEKNLLEFCRHIMKIVVFTIVFIFLANVAIKGDYKIFDFALFSIALIVSIIPEALPTVVTFALSQGALKLARQKVVVRRLSAIEDLGGMEILCTDKTGTLTENKLEADKIYSPDSAKCLLYAALNPSSFSDAMERKISSGAKKDLEQYDIIKEIPFDSFRMRDSILVEDGQKNRILVVKGAPEYVLKLSSGYLGNLKPEEIKNNVEKDGREGKRTLAIAFKKFDSSDYSERDEKDLTFMGYISFIDPLKKTAKETIETAKKMGIQIKIITGDSKEVAGAVAKAIGLVDNADEVILGEHLDSFKGEDFGKTCEQFKVFARISPKVKLKIIKALEKKFEVGFLGEGINDTPALKAANVAIAVKEATDVSREVSDIILLERDLKVIVDGIKDGRNIFANINKYMKCTLSNNFGNFYSVGIISLMIPYLPMLPIQILMVNLLSDFPSIGIATDKVDIDELRRPRAYQLSEIIWLILFLAMVNTMFDILFFATFKGLGEGNLQTLWFVENILTEIVIVYSVRTRNFFLKAKRPSIPLMALSFLSAVTTISLPYTDFGKKFLHFVSPPPALSSLFTVLLFVVCYFAVSEVVKLAYFKYKKKNIAGNLLEKLL